MWSRGKSHFDTTTCCFRLEDENVKVHFNVHFDPAQGRVATRDIAEIIGEEITLAANTTIGGSPILGDLVINADSIEIQGNWTFCRPLVVVSNH